MHLKAPLFALLAVKVSSLALPEAQVDTVEIQDPVADLIAAYEEAVDIPVDEIVIPSVAEAEAGHVDSSEAIAAAVSDAVAGGLERRQPGKVRRIAESESAMDVPGFFGPFTYGDKTIFAPRGDTTYMGVQTFPRDTSYDPNICAEACKAKTGYNIRHAVAGVQPRVCRFFNSYTVLKNGQEPVFTCTYYTQPWVATFATNGGSTRGSVTYSNRESNGYSIDEPLEQCVNAVTDGKSYEFQGLAFRVLDQPDFHDPPQQGDGGVYTANKAKTKVAERTGIVTRLDWVSTNWPNNGASDGGKITVGDYTFLSDQKSVLAQGFFVAPSSGQFTFILNKGTADNYGRVWVGDKAISTWNEDNADVKAKLECLFCDAPVRSSPITMTKGQIYPFTYLWSNSGSQGRSYVGIQDAAGNDVSNGNFVRPCEVQKVFPGLAG